MKPLYRMMLLAVLAAVPAGGAMAQGAPAGNVESGRELYVSKGCYSCHGYVGQGGREGPRVSNPAAFEPFILQLREPRLIMPPATETLVSNQQAADIFAFLSSLPPPPDHRTIPLLQ